MVASAKIISSGNGRYLTSQVGYWTGKETGKEEDREVGELRGVFVGSLAERWDLAGKAIERNDARFDALMAGRNPFTDELLRKGAGTTREYTDESGKKRV